MSSISGSGSSDTSGSGSGYIEVTAKQGGGPRTPPDSHSADLDSSASAISSSDTKAKRHKPMDRDEEIACLKETIKNKDADLRGLSKEIAALVVEQLAIRRIPEASRDIQLLVSIEEVITDMRKREDRLVAEVAKHEAELSELKNPKELVDAPVPAQGM